METIRTDFLVVGSGVAGLRAAIELARHGRVIVVTKDVATESATEYAQGGVAVALSDEDEVSIHLEDTLKAGDGLCREDAVRVLVEGGPARILELIGWGAEFDRDGARLAFTLEGAHSRRRILHAYGDSTGRELERVLISKVRSLGTVQRLPFCTALDLIIQDGRCHGSYIIRDGEVAAVVARATVLATGGAGQVFSRTTNPAVVTGDGMAMAFRAGAVLEDMEFVQFHPTVLFAPTAPQFLLSEALRGEGAILRNIHRETFMREYHHAEELAPRDVVSRAILSQLVRTGGSHVYLDLSHLDAEFIKKRFPKIYGTCLQYGINITRDLVPVSPAAHYMMGGVKTDLDGVTNITGLFAAGEVACTGVHGANRLASNSLLEGLVFGYRAGQAAAAMPASAEPRELKSSQMPTKPIAAQEHLDAEALRNDLQAVMWERVGIIRCSDSLDRAVSQIHKWHPIHAVGFRTRREIEMKNLLAVSIMIASAALERRGSVGGHYRSDFPQRGEGWQRHIAIKKTEAGMLVAQI